MSDYPCKNTGYLLNIRSSVNVCAARPIEYCYCQVCMQKGTMLMATKSRDLALHQGLILMHF